MSRSDDPSASPTSDHKNPAAGGTVLAASASASGEAPTVLEQHTCWGGQQLVCEHASIATRTRMRVAVYLPPQCYGVEEQQPRQPSDAWPRPAPTLRHPTWPALYYLSGKTCTEQNMIQKAGAQRLAAQLGMILVCPDPSPGPVSTTTEAVHDPASEDLGRGATYYIDATEKPWSTHYRMQSYVAEELPGWLERWFPACRQRRSIMGHSMGGHAALMLALKYPGRYASASALAPVASTIANPKCTTLLRAYLGDLPEAWRRYDVCALLAAGHRFDGTFLVDQGAADPLLPTSLRGDLLQQACSAAGQALSYHLRHGYDHSYYFVQSFIEAHLRFHHEAWPVQP